MREYCSPGDSQSNGSVNRADAGILFEDDLVLFEVREMLAMHWPILADTGHADAESCRSLCNAIEACSDLVDQRGCESGFHSNIYQTAADSGGWAISCYLISANSASIWSTAA